MMKNTNRKCALSATAVGAILALSGCAIHDIYQQQAAIDKSARTQAEAPVKARSVVEEHDGAWLLGDRIDASKPQPELYDKQVQFVPANGSTATLSEITDFITTATHVPAVIDSSVTGAGASGGSAGSCSTGNQDATCLSRIAIGARTLPSPAAGLVGLPALPAPGAGGAAATISSSQAVEFPLYRGDFKRFLDLVNTRFGVWSHYRDGKVTFFRTEVRSYVLPMIADSSTMTGSISTGDMGSSGGGGSVGAGSTGGSGAISGGGSSGGSSVGGGQQISMSVTSNPWLTLEKTAQAIAGPGAQVVGDKDLQMLVVTGSPPQCDNVERFVKSLEAQYGKHIAIEVAVYQVQENEEHNYGVNLQLAYKSGSGHTGVALSGASVPTISSTSTPMTFGATILGGPLSGSSAAIQALSTLGNVSEVISRTGVTQNHKVLALQSATEETYVQSSQSTLAASVGSTTTLQTATIVPGFTSSFTPTYADGKIQVDFDMTLSGPATFTTFPAAGSSASTAAGTSSVQLLNMPITRFEQSIALNPGESLVLTGMRQQNATTTNNGVGSPYLPVIGGGLDAQKQDTIIAVVVTAKLI